MLLRKVIEDFPNYEVSEDGSVYTIFNGLRRRPSLTRNGAVKITLHRNGVPYTRSLALIVAQAHLYNDHDPEIFETPIHLDNDLQNNHVDNLAWRPRWFAVKYQTQYWDVTYRNARIPVKDRMTGDTFDSIFTVCQKYGVLFIDVLDSCNKGTIVFPTRKSFEFL